MSVPMHTHSDRIICGKLSHCHCAAVPLQCDASKCSRTTTYTLAWASSNAPCTWTSGSCASAQPFKMVKFGCSNSHLITESLRCEVEHPDYFSACRITFLLSQVVSQLNQFLVLNCCHSGLPCTGELPVRLTALQYGTTAGLLVLALPCVIPPSCSVRQMHRQRVKRPALAQGGDGVRTGQPRPGASRGVQLSYHGVRHAARVEHAPACCRLATVDISVLRLHFQLHGALLWYPRGLHR